MKTKIAGTISVKIIPVFMVFLLVFTNILMAQDKAARIDEILSKYNMAGKFNGSALVAENGRVIYEKGFGYANIEWDIPNTPDTKFRIGSITKQFTSMLIMQLVEQGKIKLDGRITYYLPYYRKETGDKVTIHHLLTHTSGIPSYTSLPTFGKTNKMPYKPDEFVQQFCSGDLEFTPGTQFKYNNSGYFILGAIIEKLTGKSYEDALKQNILEPLGMTNTGYDLSAPIIKNRASGYTKTLSGFSNAEYLDMSQPYAAGSMYSTVRDLYKWEMALYTDKLLSEKYKQMIFTPNLEHYGYGWFITKKGFKGSKDSITIVHHGGGINGFRAAKIRVPSEKHLVVLLTNAPTAGLDDLADGIVNILYNKQDYKEPENTLAEKIYASMVKDGTDKALALYDELKKDPANKNTEAEFNALGYALMAEKRFADASKVFEKNIQDHPASFNVYDSMGELCYNMGKKEEAIKYYKKSVELNPENIAGVTMLKEMGVEVALPKKDEAKTEIKVKPEILSKYTGKYKLAPEFYLTITTEGEHIFCQATGQQRFEIFPDSETDFYLKVVPAKIKFSVDEKGIAKSLTLLQNGRVMPADKVENN